MGNRGVSVMSKILTKIVPAVLTHTLELSEEERLTLMAALRYRRDTADLPRDKSIAIASLIDTLLTGVPNG